WKQVSEAWKQIIPSAKEKDASDDVIQQDVVVQKTEPAKVVKELSGDFTVVRGKPRHASIIAELITRLSKGKRSMSVDDVMESFGEKAYMLLQVGDQMAGVAGWQVENLV